MNKILYLAAVVACSGFASAASLLWDYGMSTGAYGGSWVNQTASQNFAEQVSFGSNVTVTRFTYFTNFDPSSFGTMTVKLLDDAGGIPGTFLDTQSITMTGFNFEGVFSGNNIWSVDLDLTTPYNLNAGTTYWIGASGDGFEAAQVSLMAPGDGQMAQFNAGTYSFSTGVGDQAFQLYGDIVPEPASMLVLGGLALAAIRRRRKA